MSKRYHTWFAYNDGGPNAGNDYGNLREASQEINQDMNDPEVEHAILVDTKQGVVQVFKGQVEPFRKGLDKRHPDWQLGTVGQ